MEKSPLLSKTNIETLFSHYHEMSNMGDREALEKFKYWLDRFVEDLSVTSNYIISAIDHIVTLQDSERLKKYSSRLALIGFDHSHMKQLGDALALKNIGTRGAPPTKEFIATVLDQIETKLSPGKTWDNPMLVSELYEYLREDSQALKWSLLAHGNLPHSSVHQAGEQGVENWKNLWITARLYAKTKDFKNAYKFGKMYSARFSEYNIHQYPNSSKEFYRNMVTFSRWMTIPADQFTEKESSKADLSFLLALGQNVKSHVEDNDYDKKNRNSVLSMLLFHADQPSDIVRIGNELLDLRVWDGGCANMINVAEAYVKHNLKKEARQILQQLSLSWGSCRLTDANFGRAMKSITAVLDEGNQSKKRTIEEANSKKVFESDSDDEEKQPEKRAKQSELD